MDDHHPTTGSPTTSGAVLERAMPRPHVTLLRLNRPESLNSLNGDLVRAFVDT